MLKMRLFLLLSATLPAALRAQTILYKSCPGCWNPDSLGNHRVVIRYDGPAAVAHAHIPWRLRTPDPAAHRIIVQDANTGTRILNAATGMLTRESGDVFFEPVSGKGLYYIYYLPYRNEGRSNYPKGIYWRPDSTASAGWLGRLKRDLPDNCNVV
ncbi:MAG TPA: glycoside hydrolase domain-containing protein, partial [Puia sp.]|nr:glycoside hydrolase domain-containing protein [Puia sp.]